MNTDDIFRYGKDITWSLPLLFEYEPCYGIIYRLLNRLGINTGHVNIFGAPNINWAGGRTSTLDIENNSLINKIFDYICSLNASPTLTLTNTLLQKHATTF